MYACASTCLITCQSPCNPPVTLLTCPVTLLSVQVSDQVTGMLEVRARTDEAAAAGQAVVQGFLTDPDPGAVFRSVLHLLSWGTMTPCPNITWLKTTVNRMSDAALNWQQLRSVAVDHTET